MKRREIGSCCELVYSDMFLKLVKSATAAVAEEVAVVTGHLAVCAVAVELAAACLMRLKDNHLQ